jgi:1-acyl-sn-glycerol-3-phosphate acyltransferase
MRERIDLSQPMPRFWEPKPGRFWQWLLTPLHRRYLKHHRVARVDVRNLENLANLGPNDGALICPNHSYTGDGSVMLEAGRRAPRAFHTMAAWHVFRGHGGVDGWLLQRQGVFSVDREGTDRRAIRTAIDLLAGGKFLVIFPEGEIYHLNERLTPLREGVAFMAVSAQKDLDKSKADARVWVVPTAIRYAFVDDVMPVIESQLARMEQRMMLKPRAGTPLHERIIRLGDVLLTIKEKEHVGRSLERDGDLPARIARLAEHVLARREAAHLGKTFPDEPVPVRVKQLRRKLLEAACDETADDGAAPIPDVRDALADAHLALQLYSYKGDYLAQSPTPERMAETIEKFEEDLDGVEARPCGWRRATVTFGQPIDVKPFLGGKSRTAATELTARLESDLQRLMSEPRVETGTVRTN